MEACSEHGLAWMAGSLVLALGLVACRDTPAPRVIDDGWGAEAPPAGAHVLPGAAPRSRTVPPTQRKRFELDVAGLTTLPGREPSEHLDGTLERTVAVNELGAGYGRLVAHGPPLPAGTWVVQSHRPPGSDAVKVAFAMHKLASGAWEYLVIDERWRVAARGSLPLCARCHAESPQDGLFGPPAPPNAALK